MQLLVLAQTGTDRWDAITKLLNDRLLEIRQRNPQGWADEWDQRIDTVGSDIAQKVGGGYTYRDGKDHVLVFYFSPFSAQSIESWLDSNPEKWRE